MTKKQLGGFLLITAIAVSPIFAKAENENEKPDRGIIKEITKPENRKEIEEEKELKNREREQERATSSQISTSTREREQERKTEETKTRTIQAATNISQKITREIAKIKNIINRLTNNDSIIAKLDDEGINTTTIKDKLDSAKSLLEEVEASISIAKDTISSTATSSTPNIKTKVTGVRELFTEANSNIRLSIAQIKEAYKLIREIPGVRDIEKKGFATTTVATSTATTSQNN